MKKIIALLLSVVTLFSLVSCSQTKQDEKSKGKPGALHTASADKTIILYF